MYTTSKVWFYTILYFYFYINLELDLLKATEEADRLFQEIESTLSTWADEDLSLRIKEAIKVKRNADKAARRALKARVKADTAAEEAEILGIKRDREKEGRDSWTAE